MVQGGYALVSDAKEAHGLEVAETDKVYLRAVSLQEIPFGESEEDRLLRQAELRPDPEAEATEEDTEEDDDNPEGPPDDDV